MSSGSCICRSLLETEITVLLSHGVFCTAVYSEAHLLNQIQRLHNPYNNVLLMNAILDCVLGAALTYHLFIVMKHWITRSWFFSYYLYNLNWFLTTCKLCVLNFLSSFLSLCSGASPVLSAARLFLLIFLVLNWNVKVMGLKCSILI